MLVRDGARVPDAQMKALLSLADGGEAKTRLEKDVLVNHGKDTPAAAKVLMEQKDISMKDQFTGPTTPTMKAKKDYLDKIENQTFNEIIYGKQLISAFDPFVQTWKNAEGIKLQKK